MRPPALLLIFPLSCFDAAPLAYAGDSNTIVHDGGSVTLQLAASADADNMLRGAIFFDNKPGWKTYWRDPGASGIPPGLEVSRDGIELTSHISFPAPVWIDDGYGAYAGYVDDVSLPVEIDLSAAMGEAFADAPISAWFFAGVCREVCIPVMGTLSVKASNSQFETSLEDIMAVNAAFESLPAIVTPDRMIAEISNDPNGGWQVAVTLTEGASAEAAALFASAEHHSEVVTSLGAPKLLSTGGSQATWHIPAPKRMPDQPFDLRLTLSHDDTHLETVIPAKDMPVH